MPFVYQFVVGVAAPKGSKSPKGRRNNGSVIMVESSKKVAPWSATVAASLLDERGHPKAFFSDAAKVTLEFVLTRPAYLDKGKRPKPTPHHTKKSGGDIDKLCRCVLDSITEAGVWGDDSQACMITAMKRYAEPGEPVGCLIMIEEIEEKSHGSETNIQPIRDPSRHRAVRKRRESDRLYPC